MTCPLCFSILCLQLLDCERVPGYNQWGSMESMSAFSYQFIRSPLCDYMCSFIQKLKQLDDIDMMNSVLENFSVLQVRWCGRGWVF